MTPVIIGTRGSALARWQARWVAEALRRHHPDLQVEERVVQSTGDLNPEMPIDAGGERGVFVRTLEVALLAGDVDVVVHSLKDMPTEQPAGLRIAATPQRHDPRDALLNPEGLTLAELPRGSVVATGSPRRRTQLLHSRPDLDVVPIRGNVDTRIRKMLDGQCAALVLALAGVERLQIDRVPIRPLPVGVCLPAVGQGALAIETREDDHAIQQLIEPLHDEGAGCAVMAERAFLRRLGGGCMAPATAYARLVPGDRLLVEAVVGDPDGRCLMLERESGPTHRAAEIGARLAERLLVAGAGRLLEAARGAGPPPAPQPPDPAGLTDPPAQDVR